MDVMALARDRQVLVVLGDGGVGKTTVAAAIATRLALSGRRVLAVTVDPANRLKDALGLSGRPGVEEPVPLGALGPVATGGALSAMVLDAATELDRLVNRVAPSDEARRRIMDNVFYRKAVTRMAGTHEYMAMERLLEALESGRYDLVVLDTPPERHALDFLDAPDRLDGLLGSEAFRLFVGASAGLSRVGLGAVRWRSVVLKGIGKFAGEDTFLATLDFLLAFSPLFDGFRERAVRVKALLSGKSTATVLVGRPQPGAATRLRDAADELARRGLLPSVILVNRVHAWPPPGCALPQGAEVDVDALRETLLAEPALQIVDREALARLATEAGVLALEYREDATEDAGRVAEVREAVAPVPVVAIPLMRGELRDLTALATLVGYLDAAI
jgi:anion-transporting  ArsA/GET3 family ATPase